MSNKIFRSIITTAALVLLASFVIIIGVLYGYGSREELEKAGASKIAENVEDLRKLLW